MKSRISTVTRFKQYFWQFYLFLVAAIIIKNVVRRYLKHLQIDWADQVLDKSISAFINFPNNPVRLLWSFLVQPWFWKSVVMSDNLVEIERHKWPLLRDLYAPHSPVTFIGHNLVANFIRWTKQDPDIANIALYCLNEDWSDGTFAATVSCNIRYLLNPNVFLIILMRWLII